MNEKVKPVSNAEKVKPEGKMHLERVLRFLWYGAFPRLGNYIHSMSHAILKCISNLNSTDISSQKRPEVDSQSGK